MGLFEYGYEPKPSAIALHNLTAILADHGANADTFTPHDLACSVSNLPEGGSQLTMEKSSGAYDIVLWAEPDIWDQANNRPIAATATQSTVDFGSAHYDVRIYDPLLSDQPIAEFDNVTLVVVPVSDHPVVVEVTPVGSPKEDLAAEASNLVITLLGTAKPNTLDRSSWDNVIKAAGGDDFVLGGGGDDVLYGGSGNDTLSGNAGDDRLYGGYGNDLLDGGDGNDQLYGAAGADVLSGGLGDDLLAGGDGRDVVTGGGGGGADVFKFDGNDARGTSADTVDVITDWNGGCRVDLPVKGSLANYYEGSAADFASAVQLANAHLSGGVKICSVAVGTDVYVFAELSSGHAGYDLAVDLRHAELADLGWSNFI